MTAVWALGGLFVGVLCGGGAVYVLLSRTATTDRSLDQRALLDALDDALALVDDQGTIQMTNEAFERAFGTGVAGEAVADVFADMPALKRQIQQRTDGVVGIQTGEGPKHYEVNVSSVQADTHLVLLHDVTGHERHREQLEAQNERLDQFASFISHDLRNPLDVAIGRTNAIGRMNDDPELDPHIGKIQESLERMHQIITDVLALARHGDEIGDQTWTQLDSVASEAWGHVETDGATLDVESDLTLMADRDSLIHVFENLFRNSVEHGSTGNQTQSDDAVEHGSTSPDSQTRQDAVEHAGSDVTVHIGRLDDDSGFFVADDGGGIPPSEREAMLEAGATTSDDGTGLGLAIVSTIATAHGWTLTITDSWDGGARFEFSGVELAPGELAAAGT